MKAPHYASEAFFVQAMAEIEVVLDRVEALAEKVGSAACTVERSCTGLEAQVAAVEARMAQLAAHAHDVAAEHIARTSRELMHEAAHAECQSVAAFTRALVYGELQPAVNSLVAAAKSCTAARSRSRVSWWACAALVTASAIVTGALTFLALAL